MACMMQLGEINSEALSMPETAPMAASISPILSPLTYMIWLNQVIVWLYIKE
jgi:hypothetical protein